MEGVSNRHGRDRLCESRSNIDSLVLDLFRGYGVEKNANTSREFFGRPANRDDDSRVGLCRLKIPLRQGFEVHPIVCHKRFPLTCGESQLVRIRRPNLSGRLRCRHPKAPGAQQLPDQDVYVFVKVQVDKKPVQRVDTRGSIGWAGMRFRSMWALISSWWSL